ncbi:MAG TPA: hypothetical protein VFK02_00360 [Kofleriaceae bacterium]|nr:hypothetical protein [Kofleriaceae bacterium]
MTRIAFAGITAAGLAGAAPARGDVSPGQPVAAAASSAETAPGDLDLRLTLSTFLYRETGGDAPAVVDQGATLSNASPVRRYFGDLRAELSTGGLALDARIRQTTSERYQAGASGGGEYELRTLAYRAGAAASSVTVGRQFIDAVGATRIDGVSATRKLSGAIAATVFGGAYPQLGSRSLDTDYVHARNADGSDGALLVPLAGGLGVAYQAPSYHGDLGAAAVHVAQDVPGATSAEKSRVFTTSSGYWRLGAPFDAYHFAVLDVAGGNGVHLTNGSVGLDARPVADVQLTASVHHVSTDVLQIAARNLLSDPDPSAIGVVQNNLAVLRISQDTARAAASVALADQRFELSASGGLHRRPEVAVALADGSGTVAFPEARSADATFAILDRRSLGGLRAQLSGSLTYPVGSGNASRARGSLVRVSATRTFSQQRGQLEADIMAERFRDVSAGDGMCMTSLDAFACYGTSRTVAAQAGALASWRIGREWLLVADAHAGYRDVHSTSIAGPVAWPKVYSVTSFIRLQWRVR